MAKMLILRGIRNQLDEPPAVEYARRRGYDGIVLQASGETGPRSDQTIKALAAFRRDPEITALYGFSGGGYNVRHILNALTQTERSRINLVVVLGAPSNPRALYNGPWELVYRTDPPAGHMAGPRALLAELSGGDMGWRVAKSLLTLRDQVNVKWPNRSKSSDGTIGDTAHASRTSDHNPNSAGVVTAMDITHDPAHGLDARKLAESLIASRDKRILTIISNGQILSSVVSPWKWRPYNGSNAHRAHVHISVARNNKALYDDVAPWSLDGEPAAPPQPLPKSSGGFERCLPVILKWEGGNDDDPADPGGRTSRGITAERWAEWRREHPKLNLPADVWQAPQDQVVAIYREKYWDELMCDQLPPGVDLAVFDFGVNSGTKRSADFLQKIVGARVDGKIGLQTLAKVREMKPDEIINRLLDDRMTYLRAKPHWGRFGKGWTNRVNDIRSIALATVSRKYDVALVGGGTLGVGGIIGWFSDHPYLALIIAILVGLMIYAIIRKGRKK